MTRAMFRRFIIYVLLIFALLTIPAYKLSAANTASFNVGSTVYNVNGILKIMDVAPFIKGGRTYVPVRYLAYSLGVPDSGVSFDGKRTVILSDGTTMVTIYIGDPTIIVNGKPSKMDVAPTIISGRTVLPVRYITEAFGGQVSWNSKTSTVVITIPDSTTTPPNNQNGSTVTFTWSYGGCQYSYGPLTFSPQIQASYMQKPHPQMTMNTDKTKNDFQYYADTYTQDPDNQTVIHPLTDKLKELAQRDGFENDIVPFATSFVQSIPYVSSTGNDDYTKYPLETLYDKGGDCKDKSILMAAILRELGYDCALLIFPGTEANPGHMAVGVLEDQGFTGSYFALNGNKYFYLETTTSGWNIGQLPSVMNGLNAYVVPVK